MACNFLYGSRNLMQTKCVVYICTLCMQFVEVCNKRKELGLSIHLTFKRKSERLFRITVCKL